VDTDSKEFIDVINKILHENIMIEATWTKE
jgi:hypothetical protein